MDVLPIELIYKIIMGLKYVDLLKIFCSCKIFYMISLDDRFWLDKIIHDFTNIYKDSLILIDGNHKRTYLNILANHEFFPGCQNYASVEICFRSCLKSGHINMAKHFLNMDINIKEAITIAITEENFEILTYMIDNKIIGYYQAIDCTRAPMSLILKIEEYNNNKLKSLKENVNKDDDILKQINAIKYQRCAYEYDTKRFRSKLPQSIFDEQSTKRIREKIKKIMQNKLLNKSS